MKRLYRIPGMRRILIDAMRRHVRTLRFNFLSLKKKYIWTDSWGINWIIDPSNSLDSALMAPDSRMVDYAHLITQIASKRQNIRALDVGSNKGYFALPASKYFNEVICFEPVSSIFDQLQSNIKLNSALNVIAKKIAISDYCGQGIIYVQESLDNEALMNTGLSSIEPRVEYQVGKEKVQISTLDEVAISANFIKIDCEGLEYKVLLGGRKIIENSLPDILWEASISISRTNAENCFAMLHELGYFQYKVDENQDFEIIENHDAFILQSRNFDVFSTPIRMGAQL